MSSKTLSPLSFSSKVFRLIESIEFQDMHFDVLEEKGRVFLQGWYMERDTVTDKLETQRTRKWLIEPTMTESQIVSTCFALCMASMEHRTREWFKWRGRAIFFPHFDVGELWLVHEAESRKKEVGQ